MSSSTYPSEKHLKAARYFLAGPMGIRGNWRLACKEAGFTRVPDQKRAMMQSSLAIVQEQLEVESSHSQGAQPAATDADMQLLAELQDSDSWADMAPVARRVMAKIATGLLEASPGQVVSLKEIIARAEGKIGQSTDADADAVHVIILPTMDKQGSGKVVNLGRISDVGEDDTIPGVTLREAMKR